MLSSPSMFNDPSISSPAPTGSGYVQPNLGHALRIWWAYYWPTALISGALTYGVAIAVKAIYEHTNVPGSLLRPILLGQGFVMNYLVAFFVMRYILSKTFRHFRIALLSNHGGAGAERLRPSFDRTLRVWWTFTWRSVLYFAIAWVVVLLPAGVFVGLFRPGPLFLQLFGLAAGFVVGGAVSLFVFYSNILDEDFGDFRVSLLAREPSTPVISAANPIAQ